MDLYNVSNGKLSQIYRDDFSLTQVQENVVLIRNQLTNFDLNGNFHQTWECTYVMTKSDEKWKISLATTNNRATTSVRDQRFKISSFCNFKWDYLMDVRPTLPL